VLSDVAHTQKEASTRYDLKNSSTHHFCIDKRIIAAEGKGAEFRRAFAPPKLLIQRTRIHSDGNKSAANTNTAATDTNTAACVAAHVVVTLAIAAAAVIIAAHTDASTIFVCIAIGVVGVQLQHFVMQISCACFLLY
jgi:hypothetical protein